SRCRPGRSLMLPRLVLIADRFTQPDVADRAFEAASAGIPWVMLRDRESPPAEIARAADDLTQRLLQLEPAPLLSVTASLTIAASLHLNLHLGSRDVSVAEAREVLPSTSILGYSAHAVDEVAALANEVDYLFVSPVFETVHRPGVAPLGLDGLRELVDAARGKPVFALGGVRPEHVALCVDAGAHGVAVVSGILSAARPADAARAYLDRLSDFD
ncbi:MAG TPA: thiamine phosphate synthase, partial [Rhodothermales bacterium]